MSCQGSNAHETEIAVGVCWQRRPPPFPPPQPPLQLWDSVLELRNALPTASPPTGWLVHLPPSSPLPPSPDNTSTSPTPLVIFGPLSYGRGGSFSSSAGAFLSQIRERGSTHKRVQVERVDLENFRRRGFSVIGFSSLLFFIACCRLRGNLHKKERIYSVLYSGG